MKELTKIFNGSELNIEMINDIEFMINVSGVANKYGKKFSEFENRKSFKEYLSIVEKSLPLNTTLINKEIHNKTMIHNKILIEFARWLNVEFAVWCDDFIYSYLTEEKTKYISQLEEQCNIQNVKLEQKQFQLETSQKELLTAKRKIYASSKDGDRKRISRIIKDYAINATPKEMNEMLFEYGLCDRDELLIYDYVVKVPLENGRVARKQPYYTVEEVLKVCRAENVEYDADLKVQTNLFSEVEE